ncbi:cell division protein FtsQ/DivIB [Spiribacter halobius]|uniref:Cell division protein FtsQ n=1 Tax=Sediminicurvatus halobius TaxID=2182432 RepID=A0A2U2N7K6_9GAMM|nr:cell division protein FtsQ/DivIB [Spiribacter halobius]PWG65171.1 cell division protein FtsQ [Spiribacter halobius]UEX78878.1 cell division protein FtsQ/DivIB [Spiribacter halobius]
MAAVADWNGEPEAPRASVRAGARLLLWLALALVLASGLSLALEHWLPERWFPLAAVRFDGDLSRVREADLRAAVAPHLDAGLLSVDVGALRGAVEALPWVSGAAVRRVWPDAVRITVTEQVPVALWGGGALMNADGEVFRPERLPQGLPRLAGPPGSADRVLTRFRELRPRLAAVGLETRGLTLDERRSWTVHLAGDASLRLGREQVAERMARFLAAWPRIAPEPGRRLVAADLRYPNGFALQWQDPVSAKGESRGD